MLVQFLHFLQVSFFLVHELFHGLLLFNFSIDKLNLLIKLTFLLFSLPYQLRKLIGGCFSVRVGTVSYSYDLVHLLLFDFEVLRQPLVYLLEYFPLPAELIDFFSELSILSKSLVVPLVGFV